MKLLMVTPYFYPKEGGMENYAWNIAKGLKERFRWDIVVVAANHIEKKYKEEEIDGLKMYRLPYVFKILNTPMNPFWYFELKKIIKKERPDVINAHSPVIFIADIAGLVCGDIPFILTYHSGTMKKGIFLLDLFIGIYEKFFLSNLFKRAKKIICSSQFVADTIVKHYIHKAVVITPGVDISLFKSGGHTVPKTVLFIGRHANMYRMKGLFYLIDAMKNIPDATLKIVGEKIDTNEKNIDFVGVKSGKELVKEINNSSLVVLPSLAHYESFGMVLIEAMACKKPVVGSNIGGIPYVITDSVDGLLTEPGNSVSLASAINKILHDEKFASKLGENGYKKVNNKFLWEDKVNNTAALLKQFV